jgi:hypothetical protein
MQGRFSFLMTSCDTMDEEEMQFTCKENIVSGCLDVSPVEVLRPFVEQKRPRNFFARFMLALKIARWRAAQREIDRYAHLIDLEVRHDELRQRSDDLPF